MDLPPETRRWTERFAKRTSPPPTMVQAANYAGARHWLRAVAAAGTLDADAVAAAMHRLPVRDFYHQDTPVQANGQVLDTLHVWRVKPSKAARHPWDFYEPIATIDGRDAFTPLTETGCSLVAGQG